MTIDIIGAGIGGLTTAIALKQKGFRVRIFEQAKEIQALGTGIMLGNNATQVYQRLGLYDQLKSKGNVLRRMNITNAQLRTLSSIKLESFQKKYGVENIAIHRAVLQQILLGKIKKEEISFDKKLINLSQSPSLKLTFKDGSHVRSDFLIGADGIHSRVRESLFPNSPLRNSGQNCWRGLCNFELPKEHRHELNEAWGKGGRFGFVQIAPSMVYWYAVVEQTEQIDSSTWQQTFRAFHPLIQQLLSSTSPTHIHLAQLEDLSPMKKWHKENICLIGDAAHATTPNLGQGAGQAIEDALLLADCMAKFPPDRSFQQFQQLRYHKAMRIVKSSWSIGKVAHWKSPLRCKIRDLLMKVTPNFLGQQQSAFIYKLEEVPS